MPTIKTASRACKLGFNVARNLSLAGTLAPYIREPLKSSWDAEEPWWNPRAIRYLEERLPARGRVFEWGSGGSTVWLSNHGLEVTAIESEADWAELVTKRCSSADVRFIPGSDTGTLRSEPQLRDHGEHFFDNYVAAIDGYPDETFDVIIVDGICRAECARRSLTKVKRNGIVIVDDTNWSFLSTCFDPFAGWESARIRGFKRNDVEVYETVFFHRPQ